MILPKEIKLTKKKKKKTKRNGSCNACSFESGRYEAGFHELKRDTYDLVHIPTSIMVFPPHHICILSSLPIPS